MASIRTHPQSPCYIADLRVWVASQNHDKGGYWNKTSRSTKIPTTEPTSTAQAVADEMEKIAREARGATAPAKQFFETRVASLMRAAGVEPPVKTSTWAEFSEQWLGESHAGESSLVKYTGEVGQFSRFLGARQSHDLRTISPEDLDAFHRKLMAEGRTASTARNTCKTIRSVLKRAGLLGLMESNPADLLRLTTDGSVEKLPFTREDLATIFGHYEAKSLKEWRIASLFGLYYGMRVGDATSRDFSEIKVENGVRVIRFVPIKKKRKGREIALPLVGELADLQGEGPITPGLFKIRQPSKAFGVLLEHTKIEIRRREVKGKKGRKTGNKSFHSFRHTINSLLVDTGADNKIRQQICDHDDEKMNARYTHGALTTMSAAITKAVDGLTI